MKSYFPTLSEWLDMDYDGRERWLKEHPMPIKMACEIIRQLEGTAQEGGEMKPALTPEEWKLKWVEKYDKSYHDPGYESLNWRANLEPDGTILAGDLAFDEGLGSTWHFCRHALAALALHGEPFGFTWKDVDACRNAVPWSGVTLLYDLADRIAALLPPRAGPENP